MNTLTAPLRESSTKREILLLLKKLGSTTIQEMSEHLGVTGMAVRKHVNALKKDNYIQSSTIRQHIGRPTYIYSLTDLAEQLFPTQYDVLSLELMEEINHMFGELFVDELFKRRKKRLEQKYRLAMTGQNFEEKIVTLAKIQDNAGYMTSLVKIHDDKYSLEEGNCPIFQVASRYRQACQCELAMFESLLDSRVERKECIADGGTKCSFTFENI